MVENFAPCHALLRETSKNKINKRAYTASTFISTCAVNNRYNFLSGYTVMVMYMIHFHFGNILI